MRVRIIIFEKSRQSRAKAVAIFWRTLLFAPSVTRERGREISPDRRQIRMKSGDEIRLEALKEIHPRVVRVLAEVHDSFLQFLRRTLPSEADAEDVMQQFSLRALTRAMDIQKRESVRAWLGRVLKSVLTDYYRRESRRRRAEADFARKEAATPLLQNDLEEVVCLCLYKLLPVLKPEYATILRRSDLEDEPRQSIAADLGLT